jgi:hypothetical protein
MNDVGPCGHPWPKNLGHQQNDEKGQREAGEGSKEGEPSHLQSMAQFVVPMAQFAAKI